MTQLPSRSPAMVAAERPVLTALHPLEPLSPDEITEAVRILRSAKTLGPRALLHHVDLLEPQKSEVHAFRPGDSFERRAHITVLDHEEGSVHEATISITHGKLLTWE